MKTVQFTRILFFVILFAIACFSCKKETEEVSAEPLSDYVLTQPGKYIIYQLDSTVFTNFGTSVELHSYQEKQEVDTEFIDGEGRKAYRVYRSLRAADGTGPWSPAGTFAIIPQRNSVELVENNLRFVRLAAPVKAEGTWKGNRFLPDEPYNGTFAFSNDDNMADWDYTFTNTGETINLNGQAINDVITVEQINESANAPVVLPGAYGFINYAMAQYAKGIGLVYEEVTMWEYQPNPGGNSGYRTGFGVKRSMIEHN